jgi:hypothetical protein
MPRFSHSPAGEPTSSTLRLLVLAVATAAFAAGCHSSTLLAPGVSDSTFVSALAALHNVAIDTAKDSTSKVQAREEVLRRHKVTIPLLEEAARSLAKNPQRAVDLWAAIDRKTASAP